ncbi:DUF84 family protein [Metabacillus arenae]|uniref:Probable inosine/xanthosine triphosphatase n=1 Tax=Metabacillus arenae TaxID=2771434 RepID=A0A926RWR0_9BACI|nr:DUF84 family protein [Metabacillus arenae]MBD1380176.1 DUF84 family protein [Metabacillus arenae]
MKIAIGSLNPVKVNAVKRGFEKFTSLLFVETNANSNVSSQPFSDEETMQGAINRSINALENEKADLGIGLEGGVVETPHGFYLCNWGALKDPENKPIVAGGARLLLPDEIGLEVKAGRELGDVMDQYTKKQHVRKEEGAIGIFSSGFVKRTDMFTHIVKLLAGQYLYYADGEIKRKLHASLKNQK